ncbi:MULTISPECIES: proteasome-type protease [unclassified Brevundimonas]|jgi:putative proteasome-type protease|uniref:proteasome-type protease n=1 Tax=unclassified Brevundimonas TaxID=2622653 RepID=UPI000C672A75|nr:MULTISPECIES: proteasome-type protease [unclassified Brevundimonas]MAL87330.1 peptidase [Brevundimonas sp.]HAJ03020.1 peptidase [Brevundimonas sp.]HAV49593.1 peptidase [Brevundimonas sp.]|tara:strand:- start:42545 stop:43276 length:732 start_codon:yes stop_codon:yes gene_type:complete
MTYCVGMRLNKGLVFMSDTRTNAGVDNVATVRKMFTWHKPGERMITLMTAGNLATTQSVVSILDERTKVPAERNPSLLETPTMFQAARLVGEALRETIQTNVQSGQSAEAMFGATLIMGGQIKGTPPRLFLIYPQGNFIEATDDNPYFQIGETKYGRPILVRGYDPDMSFEQAVKLLVVSFDSTLKANLSVGLPIDFQTYTTDQYKPGHEQRIERDDPYYQTIAEGWAVALRSAFLSLPDPEL